MLSAAFLADVVLVVHLAVVLFVVLGLVATVIGGWRHWPWTRRLWFRVLHMAAIAVVVAQAWLGQRCPLTSLEMHWRREAGQLTYGESFIAHWLGRWLYRDFPDWVFVLLYTLFAGLVVLAWWRWPPVIGCGNGSRNQINKG